MRLFIAIEIPKEIKDELHKLQNELRRAGAEVSWTRPENIHLTLRFLGEVGEYQLEELKRLCVETAAEFHSFKLQLKDTGYFPGFRNPRVLWVGLAGQVSAAGEVQKRLEEGLISIGFDQEDKPFKPHLTIGRVKSGKNVKPLVAASDMYPLPELPFEVGEIVLMKSELQSAGAQYTPLVIAPLKQN